MSQVPKKSSLPLSGTPETSHPPSLSKRSAKPRPPPPDPSSGGSAPLPLLSDAPNPNRRTFVRDSDLRATRLINPDAVQLAPEGLRRIERSGAARVAITLIGLKNRETRAHSEHTLGVSVRSGSRVVFMKYPVQGNLHSALPLALEEAVSRTPGIADLEIATPYKELWASENYTAATRQRLLEYGCRIKTRHPAPGDLGGVLARMAAGGVLSPVAVDFHVYTASITDGQRAYTAAVVWGDRHANFYLHTLPIPDLALAETAAATWAMGLMPAPSTMMIINANPELAAIWEDARGMRGEMREAFRPIGQLIKRRQLRFKQGAEGYHHELALVSRQMAANLYASTRPAFKAEQLRTGKKA